MSFVGYITAGVVFPLLQSLNELPRQAVDLYMNVLGTAVNMTENAVVLSKDITPDVSRDLITIESQTPMKTVVLPGAVYPTYSSFYDFSFAGPSTGLPEHAFYQHAVVSTLTRLLVDYAKYGDSAKVTSALDWILYWLRINSYITVSGGRGALSPNVQLTDAQVELAKELLYLEV